MNSYKAIRKMDENASKAIAQLKAEGHTIKSVTKSPTLTTIRTTLTNVHIHH